MAYSCQIEGSTGAVTLRQPVDREQRELYRLTIRLSDTIHTTDISQILLVGFPYIGLAGILVSSVADPNPGSRIRCL